MFCPKCGSILRPKDKVGKKILFCSCGFTKKPDEEMASIVETVESARIIEVIEKLDSRPKIKIKCEKCEHKVAYYWTQQTRAADEPETRFFKCEKCEYTWREY